MSTKPNRILLFAAKLGYQTRSFEDAARSLGVELLYITDRCHQLDDPWNDRALPVHFESPEEAAHSVIEAFRADPPGAILAVGDRPALAASYAARGLGILHNHSASVEACRSKLRTREVFREAGLLTPKFRAIAIDPPPEPALLGISYPCVLKPLSLSASQGVMRANHRDEFFAAAARLQRLLASPEIRATREPNLDQILVEEYIPGREVAVEGLLSEGDLRVLAIFDKPDPLEGPFFEETIYVTPLRFSEAEQRAIRECAQNAVRALGLLHGPIHAEFRTNERGVWPLEVAPRPIGGLCGRALRFTPRENSSESFSLEELLLRHALGLSGADAPRESAASAVMMIPVPRSGTLEKIEGEEAALSTPGITELNITARLHDYIRAWPEGSSYLGFLFAKAATPAEAEAALREAHSKLKFTLMPRLATEHPATRQLV
ncbi:MAG TPA: ATP-grasp domain-containing protein [Candidatus Acidoferrales bacterium]|nr:ATP-grasp domain-containing protein [Candidatus Acidoferrales bacterium]